MLQNESGRIGKPEEQLAQKQDAIQDEHLL